MLHLKPKRVRTGREWEKKKIIVPILPTQPRIENSEKNSKKIQKIKMHNSGFISSQNGLAQVEKERKKNYCSDPSYTTLNRKFQKKGKKIQQN